ncbi:MAG: DUF1015 family protein, partial [Armatimonadota bacterium]
MAEIAPFRGIRYDQSQVGDLSKVVSPPYDVISPEDRIYYHRLHPANFVRLVLGEEFDTDDETQNRFTRAGSYLEEWLARGILKPDPQPAIYVYQQIFNQGGAERRVRGFTCAVKLHDYSERIILPHENTLAKPKSQLIRLMRATRANLDSIYALYADESGVVDAVLDRVMSGEPAARAVDKNGVQHLQWILSDPADIRTIVEFLEPAQIAIADGHHRYETSLAYRDEVRGSCWGDESASSAEDSSRVRSDSYGAEYTLMTLVNVHQKDMTVFPTHRVVKGLPPEVLQRLDNDLAGLFETAPSSAETLLTDMARLGAIGMYSPDQALTLKPRPQSRELM